jgi:hypothetical protein
MDNKRKSVLSRIASIAIMLALGGAFGYGLGLLAKRGKWLPVIDQMRPEGIGEMIWLATVFVVSLWLVLAVHELGHLLAGLAQGFRFGLYIAGPLGGRRSIEQPYLGDDGPRAGLVDGRRSHTIPLHCHQNIGMATLLERTVFRFHLCGHSHPYQHAGWFFI